MKIAKLKFSNENEKKEYVGICEARFEAELDEVMKAVCSRDELKFLTLTGPTCSGKTTASKKLISEFAERGRKVKIISLDDFFKDRSVLVAEAEAEGRALDFDSEKALDIPCLSKFMEDIQAGREAVLPKFDFNEARRISTERFTQGDADLIVFEGIQAIYPVFTELLEKGSRTATMCIAPFETLKAGNREIEPNELRLWRRLVRDYYFRSAGPEFSFLLWETVRENEDRNILPYLESCEYRINSVLGYDIGMLKNYLEAVLSEVKPDSKYYAKSREILETVSVSDSLQKSLLPVNSLYHEFV